MKFFLIIEFAAAIEFLSAFQMLVKGEKIGGFPVCPYFNIFFLKDWTVLPKTKVLEVILSVGYRSDLLRMVVVVLQTTEVGDSVLEA